jgi:hypothetical protein
VVPAEHPSFAAIRLPLFDALFKAVARQAKTSKDREREDGAFCLQRSSRMTIQKSAEAARESAQHRSRVMFYDDCRAKRPWQHSLVGGAPSDPLNSSRLGGELRNASPVMKVPVPVPGDAPYHVEQNLIYFWNHSI